MTAFADAVSNGTIGRRLWLYANYRCNLRCAYCLTESGPRVAPRELPVARLGDLAVEARDLGFTSIGITGGEPFLLPGLPEALAGIAAVLPTLVLSNGTLFNSRLLARMRPLAGLDLAVQVSLDSARPDVNDEMRGPRNFAKVVAAIPRLRELGIRVRVATTAEGLGQDEMADLCALHRSLGVSDDDHVVRPIIRRGRAAESEMGVEVSRNDLPAELTITVDGAFWSPFGPTVRSGRLDTDLLITRNTMPLTVPVAAMLRLAQGGAAQSGAQRAVVR